MNAEDQSACCDELAAAIAQWLGQGMTLSPEARHFLESTFGCSYDQEVVDMLQDSAHPEGESILELVFSPSFDLRLKLEPVLEKHAFDSRDTSCLLDCFFSRVKELVVLVGPQSLPARMPLTQDAARRFLERLHFHIRLDDRLSSRIQELFADSSALLYKTLLRQARFSLDSHRRDFVILFLEQLQDHADRDALFRFVLHFLEETPLGEDLQQALLRKRMLLEHTLKRSRQLQQQIQTHAMETLIMQRVNVLHINEQEVLDELRRIDDICWHMFGHLPPASDPETEMSLSWNAREDPFDQIFNRFTDLD